LHNITVSTLIGIHKSQITSTGMFVSHKVMWNRMLLKIGVVVVLGKVSTL